ncbi:SWIM zinc finger family protein [Micromonospora echinofusca]|uniref:SWIM zinc finger family protein n=1 Tax=Micromonospora echinofusca TaxID=47858 RepID=A0ABS3VYQ5_MICEH|nr:SWIM zinc finger family protein [Micromonospora echinofusca]MBO4209648.1 SWIM zinc finger family protein [Micromonospora echinofusca]
MPVDRWSTAQVLALAPDASSAKGARSVSGAAKWAATGLTDDVLWGLCKGSGSKPYQVCVDLSGPAYRCSCPSRKFPCKHALGLLLLWASGVDGGSTAPDWVVEWQTARAAKAAKAAAPKAAAGPTDPAAAAKRAEQRGARVAAGLDELRRWLDDQVQQGLAETGNAGHRPFETVAARLVDAQAPTVAATVRRLGQVAGVGAHWSERLLGELGLVRLLVTAAGRLDELPADLAATVRSRIGFPVSSEEVLAGPPVRDRWQVLGQVDSTDDKVTTRRTWLRGVDSGRFALLLAFAAPGQAFPADVVPGTEVDADLYFHPGAWPLRALVGARHAAPVPLDTPAGAVGVRDALVQYAAALAADPWRETVPVLLAGVVPSGDGHLVDAAGDALPLTPGYDEPWWLLAAAGGRPATLAGEYGPDGLRPLAAWPDRQYQPAAAGAGAGVARRATGLPAELLSAALVGTGRRPWAGGPVPVGGRPLGVGGDDSAGSLLEAAAVAVTYLRASGTPVPGRVPVDPAPTESVPVVPPAAAARLHLLLAEGGAPGGAQVQQDLLAEWLRLAAAGPVVLPPEALPALLDAGRRSTALRPLLARLAGQRGRWLAGQRPEWGYLLDEAPAPMVPADGAPSPAVPADTTPPPVVAADATAPGSTGTVGEASVGIWETGTGGERLAYLTRLRSQCPDAGRELLESTFATESAPDRARFVEALRVGLSPADDGFLERALDDRRREVRQAAVELLRRLPGSGLRQRMADRALAVVRLDDDRLVVDPPAGCDAAMRRDGVDPQPPRGVGPGAWLLEEILAATPLATWTDLTGRPPAGLLALPVGDDWAPVLRRGWARAAVDQQDVAWADALVDGVDAPTGRQSADLPDALRWRLHELLPADRLTRLAADTLRSDPNRAHRLLGLHPGPWPDELADTVADTIGRRARGNDNTWHLAELCRLAALAMPPHYTDRISRLAEALDADGTGATEVPTRTDAARVRTVSQLAAVLAFRSEMHKEFR